MSNNIMIYMTLGFILGLVFMHLYDVGAVKVDPERIPTVEIHDPPANTGHVENAYHENLSKKEVTSKKLTGGT